jgi:pyruvate dehydrogenase E2 component (dihydrolipoamide acetyltransferase)
MATLITMPKLSDTMTTGTVVKWLKKEGDAIESGDVIAEIETDKTTMALQAFDSGTLLKIVAAAGAQVPCMAPVGVVGEKGEKIDESLLNSAPAATPPAQPPAKTNGASTPAAVPPQSPAPPAKPAAPAASAPAPQSTIRNPQSEIRAKASPLAKKVARELNVDLSQAQGTGPGGRIVKKDVLDLQAAGGTGSGWGIHPKGPIAQAGRTPLSTMRRIIATRLVESKTQIPHIYLTIEVDAAPLVALRQELNASFEKLPKPFKLSLNDFIMKATAEAIRLNPAVNASFTGDAIEQYPSVHLAFAAAIPDGLITPIVRDAQDKTIKQISDEVKALAGKAKEGKLQPSEFQGGTFTVSNLGMYGIDQFDAIINPPQAAILAVANVVKKPVVHESGEIVAGQRLNLTLSCDHRVVDGAVGAAFLRSLRELIEKPAQLLL